MNGEWIPYMTGDHGESWVRLDAFCQFNVHRRNITKDTWWIWGNTLGGQHVSIAGELTREEAAELMHKFTGRPFNLPGKTLDTSKPPPPPPNHPPKIQGAA